jgi:hypothetical protein
MHYGEGTFLRVELCQRPSYSLHAAVSITASKPSDNEILTRRGFHRVMRHALEHHMALKPVEVIAYFEDLSGVLSRPLVVDFDPIVSIEEISVRR